MEEKPKPKIEDLFSEIENTLKIIQNHPNPIQLTPDLLADISKLEIMVHYFKNVKEELFNILEINSEENKKAFLESSEVRSSDKQLIKQAEDIQQNAALTKLALSEKRGKETKNNKTDSSNKKTDKQQIRERRKLFKTIGGDKNWLPL